MKMLIWILLRLIPKISREMALLKISQLIILLLGGNCFATGNYGCYDIMCGVVGFACLENLYLRGSVKERCISDVHPARGSSSSGPKSTSLIIQD